MLIKVNKFLWSSSKTQPMWLNPHYIKEVDYSTGQSGSVVTLSGGDEETVFNLEETPEEIAELITKARGAQ